MSYDSNRNQLSETVNGTSKTFTYNKFNQLTGFSNGNNSASYTYNPSGARRTKTVNGVTTNFVWNGSNLAYEKANGKENYYYYDITGITSIKADGVVKNYLKNSHGDVTAIADSSGTIIKDYVYDAFGNEVTENTADTNPFRYAGEYFDAETGQIYLRNRYYDPSTGRFISEDPVMDGLNWYVYCGNNPVIFIDPLGLAITPEDIDAYNSGKLSDYYWELLLEADEMWNNAKEYDYNTKALAHYIANVARESYGNYSDDFDYTFGTGYSALDMGEPGKYIKTAHVSSSTGNYSATVFLYYERYVSNDRNYIRIIKSNGYGTGVPGRIRVNEIEYTYGATEWFGGKQVTNTVKDSQYSIVFQNMPSIIDSQGVYHTTGINVKFEFSFSHSGQKKYLEIINHVYETVVINENGNEIDENPDVFDSVIEALQRGER